MRLMIFGLLLSFVQAGTVFASGLQSFLPTNSTGLELAPSVSCSSNMLEYIPYPQNKSELKPWFATKSEAQQVGNAFADFFRECSKIAVYWNFERDITEETIYGTTMYTPHLFLNIPMERDEKNECTKPRMYVLPANPALYNDTEIEDVFSQVQESIGKLQILTDEDRSKINIAKFKYKGENGLWHIGLGHSGEILKGAKFYRYSTLYTTNSQTNDSDREKLKKAIQRCGGLIMSELDRERMGRFQLKEKGKPSYFNTVPVYFSEFITLTPSPAIARCMDEYLSSRKDILIRT
jgi:hypothetical protein